MLFNSFNFLFFLIPVLIGFYIINKYGNVLTKNIFLLIVSYVFYGMFNVSFLAILAFVTIVNYVSIKVLLHPIFSKKKATIAIGIILSLLPLVVFKYTDFFLNNVLMMGGVCSNLILPVGISFFTFQALSYTIDIYRGKETQCPTILDFALYVSFFPCILSGPIERARNLMPQIRKKQTFDLSVIGNGLQVFLWGVFQKNVIAEGIAWYTDWTYRAYDSLSGSTIWLAILLYSIQIYCDFAGYSNMAIGIGRMLGFDIRKNFNFPYFSSNIREFWKKWHISLTSWLTEYLYISLGGNRVKPVRWIANILIVFVVSGLWHGAAWTFIIWGFIHGIYQVIEHYLMPDNTTNRFVTITKGIFLYFIVSIAWLLFRSESISEAGNILMAGFTNPFDIPNVNTLTIFLLLTISLVVFVILEILLYKRRIKILDFKDDPVTWPNLLFSVLIIVMIEFVGQSGTSFVYFQF